MSEFAHHPASTQSAAPAWKSTLLIACVLLLVIAPSPSRASGHVNAMLGPCMLQDDGWNALQDGLQGSGGAVGLFADFGRKSWPVHVGFSFGGCGVDATRIGTRVELSIDELGAGVYWYPLSGEKRLAPYLGGGWTHVEVDGDALFFGPPASSGQGADSTSGLYLQGGFTYRFEGPWTIGVDLRQLFAGEVDVLGVQARPDTFQTRLIGGFRW